jgi:hypothetical protein
MEGKTPKRHLVMMNHGFRKFFETNSFKAGMNNIYLRRLMGQKAGLEDAYLKTSEEELLEGDSRHIGYIGAIDQLTINEEHKLRREVEHYKVKASQFDSLRAEIDSLREMIKR